jgi:PPK2 family polyphosphate:nucleotide phosphotransferase
MQESRQTSGRLTEEHHVAKPGGKTESKRKQKRAEKQQGKAAPAKPVSAKRGSAKPGPAKAAKAKAPKAQRPKGAQRLVERIATEIVVAELDRAVAETAEAPEALAVSEQEAAAAAENTPAAEPKKKAANPAAVKAAAVEAEKAEAVQTEPVQPEAVQTETVEPTPVKAAAVKRAPAKRTPARARPAPAAVETAEPAEAADPVETEEELASDVAFAGLLRVAPGPVDLTAIDPASTLGVSSREKAEARLPKLAEHLNELQERLFAAARGGDSKRRLLLVLQGMDTSGKGGTVRHVVSQFDPNGVRLTAFKAPTEEERAHDFLWRIRNALPAAGEVGIFDRSHYEDVLIARVRKLALPMVIGKRYQLINKFEQNLVADGAVVVKCFLHISRDEQKRRLLARLDGPQKHWKYNPADVDERELWPQYQEAYRLALEKCSTDAAPWHVIPADHKWYRNYAITRLLVEALEQIDPQYPAGHFDVEVERKRVLAS